ncbi:MAG: cytochrome c oxidase subunit CcoM [Halomonas sp.]|nr:cytochrome c oxidase subunit CcoM [Halomonas sp.]
MYWDEAVIFGLATVGLLIAFMGGFLAFVMHDNRCSKAKAKAKVDIPRK